MSKQLRIFKMPIAWRYLWLPVCFVVLVNTTSFAQYSLFHAPSGIEEWSYSELMNCTIMNGSSKTPLVYINCTVSSNQRVVLRAQSNVFRLNTGANLITRADVDNKLTPIKTLYLDAQIRAMMEKTALPMDGQYDVKLDLVEKTETAVLTYGQYYKNVKSITPFRLITPFDGSTINTLNPTFTWTRPLSMGGSFEGQTYNLKVVEVYKGQSAFQAIRSNTPVLRQEGLSYNLLQTPYNNEHLQACKKYAWQVEVVDKINGQKGVNNISEVWDFTTSCSNKITKYIETPYYQASTKLLSVNYPAYDTLRVSLEYSYTDVGKMKARIIESTNKQKEIILTNSDDETSKSFIHVGDNRFIIPLSNKKLVKNKQYLLEITDGTERYFVPFEYLYEEQ